MNIEQAIRKAVLDRTAEIVDEEAKAAAERVTKRVREMTAQIAATVCTRMSFEAYGQKQLKIIVEFDGDK